MTASQSTISTAEVPAQTDEHNYFRDDFVQNITMSPKSALTFAIQEIDKLKGDHKILFAENVKLRKCLKDKETARFSYDDIKHDNAHVKLHTGIVSAEVFDWIFEQIQHKLPDLQYYKGKNSYKEKSYKKSEGIKPGPPRLLQP